MTTASISPGQVSTSSPAWLWAVIAALAATSLALGASLWQMRTQNAEPLAAQDLVAESPPATPTSARASSNGAVATATAPQVTPKVGASAGTAAQNATQKQASKPVQQAQATTKKVATSTAPVQAVPMPETLPAAPAVETTATAGSATTLPLPAPAVRSVCVTCGTVEGVTPFQQPGTSSGVGAVAGAALGGLVGNQVGGGTGKTIATMLGVVGGSIAGDAVEKRMKHETRYRVDVRMEDGSLRTIQQTQPATIGERVTLDGDTLRAAR